MKKLILFGKLLININENQKLFGDTLFNI